MHLHDNNNNNHLIHKPHAALVLSLHNSLEECKLSIRFGIASLFPHSLSQDYPFQFW